eukprot:gene3399-6751_t
MFSGKSTELLRRIVAYRSKNLKTMLITSSKDTRYNANNTEIDVVTHDKHRMRARATTLLMPLEAEALSHDVIGVDELQFFEDAVEFCEVMANKGKIVISAGLMGDYKRDPFQIISKIIPKSEEITKLTAICQICGEKAPFSRRIVQSTEQELIGGADMYMACCRHCFERPIEDSQSVKSTVSRRIKLRRISSEMNWRLNVPWFGLPLDLSNAFLRGDPIFIAVSLTAQTTAPTGRRRLLRHRGEREDICDVVNVRIDWICAGSWDDVLGLNLLDVVDEFCGGKEMLMCQSGGFAWESGVAMTDDKVDVDECFGRMTHITSHSIRNIEVRKRGQMSDIVVLGFVQRPLRRHYYEGMFVGLVYLKACKECVLGSYCGNNQQGEGEKHGVVARGGVAVLVEGL